MTSTTTTADPFANPADTGGLDFADPTTEYVEIHDLDGRLICVYPKEIRREQSTSQPGKMYDKIVADVIVLDGPVTDKIGTVPMFVADMHISATAVVGALRGNVGKGRPVLGRVDSRPSRNNKQVKAYGLQTATDAEKVSAGPVVRSVLAQNMSNPA